MTMKCKEGSGYMIDITDENIKVQIDVYDKRLQLKERRIKEQHVVVTLRRLRSCDEVRIKSSRGLEVFVSDCVEVVDHTTINDEANGGAAAGSCSISLWIANYNTALHIKGPSSAVQNVMSFFQCKDEHIDTIINSAGIKKLSKVLSPAVKSKHKREYDLTSKERSGFTPELKMRSRNLPKNDTKYRYDDDDGQNGQNKENIINQHHQRQGRDSQKSLLDESNTGRSDGRPSLTSMQNKVIQACLSGKNVFCTGGAGTGKTTLLLALIDALIEMHGKSSVFVTATTGLAACAIGGTTVHQFAGIKTSIEEHDDDLSLLKQQLDRVVKQACSNHNVLKRYRDAKVLLVDEVSMLSPTLLEVGHQSS